jgi:hypothetical protein
LNSRKDMHPLESSSNAWKPRTRSISVGNFSMNAAKMLCGGARPRPGHFCGGTFSAVAGNHLDRQG